MASRIRKGYALSGLLALGLVLLFTVAMAFDDPPWLLPTGTEQTCDADVNADLIGIAVGGPITVSGSATFQFGTRSPASEPLAWVELDVRDLDHPGEDPLLGRFHLTADISRSVTPSKIEQLTPEPFPARSTLRFHGSVTFDNNPDNTYTTVDEIVIVNDNLVEWPHKNAVYTQSGSARLRNGAGQEITLSNATVTVNAQQQ